MMIAFWRVGGSNTDPLNNRSHTIIRSRHHILDDDIHASCDATGAAPHGNRQETIKLAYLRRRWVSRHLSCSRRLWWTGRRCVALLPELCARRRGAATWGTVLSPRLPPAETLRSAATLQSHMSISVGLTSRKVYTSGYNKTYRHQSDGVIIKPILSPLQPGR